MCKIWRVAPQTPFDRQSIDCPSGVTWWVKYSKSTAHLARHSVTDCTVRKRVQFFFFSFFSSVGEKCVLLEGHRLEVAVHRGLLIHTHVVRSGRLWTTDTSIMRSVKKKKKKTSCMHTSLIIKTTLRSQTFKFQANAHVLYKQMNIHPILLHVL